MTHQRVLSSFAVMEQWKAAGQKIALWIGRAKLPHVGHIAFLKALWKEGYKLVIGNGSCYTIDQKNPIQVFQIQAMLALSLRLEGIPSEDFVFVPIPDFHDDDKWRAYVTGMPHFDLINAVASDNENVMRALGPAIDKLDKITRDIVSDPIDFSATQLREAVRDNDIVTWQKYAAEGTKFFLAHTGDFYGVTSAVLGKETDFEQGRQSVDLFLFVWDGFQWCVVLGNCSQRATDFAGSLASPGGGIEDYECPIDATLFEAEEETGIPMKISERFTLPTQIVVCNRLTHLHFVGKFGSADRERGGSRGGSSLVFMTIYDGSVETLRYHIKSDSDLDNVRIIPVAEARQQRLAFQQSLMLEKAFRELEKVRGKI